MPICNTAQFGSSVCPQLQLEVNATDNTAGTATLTWILRYVAHGYAASTAGILKPYSVVIAGETVKSGSYDINGKTGTYEIARGTKQITKDYSPKTIAFSCSMAFNLTWSGVYGGTKSASGSITISPRTSYTYSFNANGGSGAPSAVTKWGGIDFTFPTGRPSREGYTFNGWYNSDVNGGTLYQPGQTTGGLPDKAVTWYAKWTAHTYTVNYNANGGSGAPGTQTKTHAVNLKLSLTKPTRENYNFLGWGTAAGSTTVAYAPGATYSENTGIMLYAIWQLAYTKPRISNLAVFRCASDGTASDTGTYAKVGFSWATDKTVTAIKIEYKTETSTTWTAITVTGTGTSGTVSKIIGGSLSTEYTYNIRITVSDSVGSSSSIEDISSMIYIMDMCSNGNGVAFGKAAQINDAMDVGYDLLLRKKLNVNIGGNIITPFNFYQSGPEVPETLWLKKRIVKESAWGSSWIQARNNAMVTNSGVAKSDGAFYPLLSTKTQNGSWNIGVLNENLAFSYDKDSDYNADNNKSNVRWLYTDGTMDNKEGYMVEAEHLKHSPLSGSYGFQLASAGWGGSHDKYFIGVNSNGDVHSGCQLNGASTITAYKLAKQSSITPQTFVVNPGGKDWVFLKTITGGNLTGAIANGDHNALGKQVTCIGHGNELRAHLSSAHSGAIRINVCPFISS